MSDTVAHHRSGTTLHAVVTAAARFQFLIGVVIALATVLGFGFTTPGKQLTVMQQDMAAVRQSSQANAELQLVVVRWICLRERERMRPQDLGQNMTTASLGCDRAMQGPTPTQAGSPTP